MSGNEEKHWGEKVFSPLIRHICIIVNIKKEKMNFYNLQYIGQTYLSILIIVFVYFLLRDIVIQLIPLNFVQISNTTLFRKLLIYLIHVTIYSTLVLVFWSIIEIVRDENNIKLNSSDLFKNAFNAYLFYLPPLLFAVYHSLRKKNIL